MPLLGRASDRFGRKMLLQVSLAGFAIGSIITALSTDLTVLVVGRVIQGAASGALLPVTLALAADLWTARNRAGVLGGIGAAQELGSVLGPMYGIALVWVFHHWQSVFWVNVPLAVIAMAMIHFSLPCEAEVRDAREGRRRRRCPAGDHARTGRRRYVQPGAGRQAGAAVLWSAAADRCAGRRCGVLRVGTLRQDPADRAGRCAFPAVPGRSRGVADRRRRADGDARQRRVVRAGRARPGPERSGVSPAARS